VTTTTVEAPTSTTTEGTTPSLLIATEIRTEIGTILPLPLPLSPLLLLVAIALPIHATAAAATTTTTTTTTTTEISTDGPLRQRQVPPNVIPLLAAGPGVLAEGNTAGGVDTTEGLIDNIVIVILLSFLFLEIYETGVL
jgi:hypothetical protein